MSKNFIPGHPEYQMRYTECNLCKARTPVGSKEAHFKSCVYANKDRSDIVKVTGCAA